MSLFSPVEAQLFYPRFVIPDIVSPDGHPPLPKALKLTRADYGLRGPVKEYAEYNANLSEVDRKVAENKKIFNQQGQLTRDFQAGPYGFNKIYHYRNGRIEGSYIITLNSDGAPVTFQSNDQGTRFYYQGKLLTGSSTNVVMKVEEMDGTLRTESWQESTQYSYDKAGRLTGHKELRNGKEVYRIYYRYNAAGQVDSIAEKRDKVPLLCFQLSYTTTSTGNTEVSYKEINYDLGISASKGDFTFSPDGRLLWYTCRYNQYHANHPSKYPLLKIIYSYKYDSYGNWTELKRDYINPPQVKEWEDQNLFETIKTLRQVSYY